MLLKIPAPGAIREAAQLVPGTRHRQTGRKGSCRGFPSLPAEIPGKAAAGQQGGTEAAAEAIRNRHPLQLIPGEPAAIRTGGSCSRFNQGSNQGANYQKAFILQGLRVLKLQFICN